MTEENIEIEISYEPMCIENVGPQDMDQNVLYEETIGDGRINDIVDPDSNFTDDVLERELREDFSKSFERYLINKRTFSLKQVLAVGLKNGLFDDTPRSVEDCAALLECSKEEVSKMLEEVNAQIKEDVRGDSSKEASQEDLMERMCARERDRFGLFDSYSEYLAEKSCEEESVSLVRLARNLAKNPFASRNMVRDQK